MRGLSIRAFAWLCLVPWMVGASTGAPPTPSAPAACPALPPDALPISGLATGLVVEAGSNTTLQFSSSVLACGEFNNDVTSADCRDRWNFNLTVPTDAISPGSFDLGAVGAAFGDLVVTGKPMKGEGCKKDWCQMRSTGVGWAPLSQGQGTIEIVAVTDTCITGRISGLTGPDFAEAPNFNGAFFAVRCH